MVGPGGPPVGGPGIPGPGVEGAAGPGVLGALGLGAEGPLGLLPRPFGGGGGELAPEEPTHWGAAGPARARDSVALASTPKIFLITGSFSVAEEGFGGAGSTVHER